MKCGEHRYRYSTKDAYSPTTKRGQFQPIGSVRVEGWVDHILRNPQYHHKLVGVETPGPLYLFS